MVDNERLGMTFTELALLLNASAAVGAMIMSIRNGRKIQNVHVDLNSRLSELLKITHDSAFSAGIKQERDDNLRMKS